MQSITPIETQIEITQQILERLCTLTDSDWSHDTESPEITFYDDDEVTLGNKGTISDVMETLSQFEHDDIHQFDESCFIFIFK